MAELKIRQVVRMPDLTGQPLRKARLMIENAGLRIDAVLFRESYEEKDTVLEQKPPRAQMVYAGDAVTLWVARRSYTDLLPAIYRRSDATGRNFVRDLCWLLEHIFGSITDKLDIMHSFYDPHECPEEFLPWLASWTAMTLDLDWPVEKKRAIIKRAVELYGIRGTVKGLKLFLKLFTGHEPRIFENIWPFKGFRIETEGLIGVDSVILPPVHTSRCFIVEMPLKFADVSPEMVIRIHNIIQLEKPANTHYYLRFAALSEGIELREFFHIGLRSGIGIRDEVIQTAEESAVETVTYVKAASGGTPEEPDENERRDRERERERAREKDPEKPEKPRKPGPGPGKDKK
jgi:phage tail-like protein